MANVRNFKIPVTLVTMTLLLLLSAHALALDYRGRLNNWSVNRDSQGDPIVGGNVNYDLADGGFSHIVGVSNIPPIQAPQPFSALIKGMDGEMDRRVVVNDRLIFWSRQNQPVTSGFFDTPDTSFVIKLLFSLFALMFSLDAASREKEAGTLRTVLAQPIWRRELILTSSTRA